MGRNFATEAALDRRKHGVARAGLAELLASVVLSASSCWPPRLPCAGAFGRSTNISNITRCLVRILLIAGAQLDYVGSRLIGTMTNIVAAVSCRRFFDIEL